jgi:hypothetical protein
MMLSDNGQIQMLLTELERFLRDTKRLSGT